MKTHTIFLFFLFLGTTVNAHWPHWRGPGYDGVSTATSLPDKWSETENVLWKIPLPGASSSTPVIVGEKILLTVEAHDTVHLLCINTAGRELWKSKVCDTRTKGSGEKTNASPSPSTDGENVYTMTGTGEVVAFDLKGKELWRFNAQERYGKFKLGFGFHTTPLLYGGKLYIQLIHSGSQTLSCLDAQTGMTLWTVDRPSDGVAECFHSYASPIAHRHEDLEVIITHGHDYTIGHDPKSGKELWRIGDLNPKDQYNRTLRFVASPVAHKGLIVAPSAKNRGVAGIRLAEASGYIGSGDKGEVWRIQKGTPDVPSPLVYGKNVYLCRENGAVICLDAETGKQHYHDRVYAQTYRASPVAANDRVIFTARDGTFSVVKAGPTLEIISKNKLDDQFTASPAIANNRLYLRGYKSLYCIGSK